MMESKIMEKGQTTIPKKIRDEIGLKPGDTVRYSIRDGVIQMRPLISAKSLKGILKYDGPPVSLDDIDEAIEQARTERWKRREQSSR